MDKKPIAFSGSHWRVTLEDSPVSITDNYSFNYAQGLGNDKYPIDKKTGNPNNVCIGGKPDRRDYIDILWLVSDRDSNRYILSTGDVVRFVIRLVGSGTEKTEVLYQHTVTEDLRLFYPGNSNYGYLNINKRVYLADVPGYKSADLFLLGINIVKGGTNNECSVTFRHTRFL